ncbi:MAG TPA: hypothetical protein VGX28_03750 [Frankiaceae bacterium]|jgi:hypothetical protein|nr:hypothetical protein [Frankiaceae bacterium]
MRLRLVAALAAATAVLATPAGAATGRPQITDPKGDVRGGVASLDIVSARWSTAGRGAGARLVASLTLAAVPMKDAPFAYELKSQVRGCGTVIFEYSPGALVTYLDELGQPAISDADQTATMWLECGAGTSDTTGSTLLVEEVTFAVAGNTMTWSVPVAALPSEVRTGSVFYDFTAAADAGDPVFGIPLASGASQSFDNGVGDGTWRMS